MIIGAVQKSSSSKAAAIFARRAYFQYVSTEKWRERRWRVFSTVPYCHLNEFTHMAAGSIFFPQVFMQFPGIFDHSCVLSNHLGHTIQPVSMRLIFVQCCKYVKDSDLHSYHFRSSSFASCQSKICSGPDGTRTVVSPNGVSCQAELEAMGLLGKIQGSSLLLRVSCAGLGKKSAGKSSKKQVGQVEPEIRQQ